ncbi:Protein of unknown function [Pyronema omphalodes CBS 100304]|uniref:Uncharacterized protein n=1 Tax=Pyronema omphalodes (strain CBS 100304) TaxID=1076935 RepID=U4KW90_PYROM|nr:Protein of unknown function [Pyronema omphalodes CBS 100304]
MSECRRSRGSPSPVHRAYDYVRNAFTSSRSPNYVDAGVDPFRYVDAGVGTSHSSRSSHPSSHRSHNSSSSGYAP